MDIGDLKDLKSLQLNDNMLIGTIPRSLTRGELSLVDLNLSNNDLSGTIPTGFSNIRYLENLQVTGKIFIVTNISCHLFILCQILTPLFYNFREQTDRFCTTTSVPSQLE